MNDAHPILFTGAMVCAIRANRKTMTRRLVCDPFTRRPEVSSDVVSFANAGGSAWQAMFAAPEAPGRLWPKAWTYHCPYGVPGDLLWVREAWRAYKSLDDVPGSAIGDYGVRYIADEIETPAGFGRYRHARFMPRWASRITLQVVAVRVHRAQKITGMDAKCEGAPVPAHMPQDGADCDWALRWFRQTWDTINGPRGAGWDANPWVWVIEFRTLEARP